MPLERVPNCFFGIRDFKAKSGLGFYSSEIYRDPEKSVKISWNSEIWNILKSLDGLFYSAFLTVEGKKSTFSDGWRLNFRPFDVWLLTPLRPSFIILTHFGKLLWLHFHKTDYLLSIFFLFLVNWLISSRPVSLKTPAKCRQRTVMLGRDAKFCAKDQAKNFCVTVSCNYLTTNISFSCISFNFRTLKLQSFLVGVAFRPLLYDHLYAILGLQDPQLSILLHGPA